MDVWNSIVNDFSMDTCMELHQFRLMADSMSRFKHITDIDRLITMGNYTGASGLLSMPIDAFANTTTNTVTGVSIADTTDADGIVNNYINYYKLLLKYMNSTLNASDSSLLNVLANKCPYIDGSVVFQSRTLYSIVFNDIKQYNDLGCVDKEGKGNDSCAARHTNGTNNAGIEQQYLLQPNPNNGNFTLLQLVTDNTQVEVQIFNEIGSKIYQKQVLFENGISKFTIKDLNTGIYLLQLKENTGKIYTVKFSVIY